MDDPSVEIARAIDEAGEDLPEAVAGFAVTLLGLKLVGPTVWEIGEALADIVRRQRFRGQVRGLGKALSLLDEAGIPHAAVDPKFLAPWFTGVWLEADEKMNDRWAALLANAAAGQGRGAPVLPSFPKILAELSPGEAVILDTLYSDPDPARVPSLYRRYTEEADFSRFDDPLFDTRCFNLERLALLEANWQNMQVTKDEWRHSVEWLEGTALGLSFVLACAPPP